MPEITLTVDNLIRIPFLLSDQLISMIKKRFTKRNPVYDLQLAMAYGKPTKVTVPKIIISWCENEKYLMIPRGTGKYVRNLLEEHDYTVHINDQRVYTTKFIKFYPKPGWDLRSHQKEARDVLNSHEQGVLESPCGGGKTLSMIMNIADKRQPSIIIMHKKDLIKQWMNEINDKFILEEGAIGTIAEGIFNPQVITLALVQTMINLTQQQWARIQTIFGMVVVEECYVEGSRVTMRDGTSKTIENVHNGDRVYLGGKVSNYFSREAEGYYYIRTSIGPLNCTENNVCKVVQRQRDKKNNQYYAFDPKTDIRDKLARDIKKGDLFYTPVWYDFHGMLGCRGNFPALLAAILADGSISKCRIRIEVVKERKVLAFKKLFKKWKFRFNPKKKSYIWWINSKDEDYYRIKKEIPFVGKKSDKIFIPECIYEGNLVVKYKFLQMLILCDGHIYPNCVDYYTTSYRFVYDLLLLLKQVGIYATVIMCKKKKQFHNTRYSVRIAGKLNLEKLNNMHRAGYTFKERDVCNQGYSIDYDYHHVKVLDIKWVNKKVMVYDFTTETHQIVVNHMIHKNCHHTPAETFLYCVNKFPARFKYGATATPTRKDHLDFLLFDFVGDILYCIPDIELEARGITMKAQVQRVITEYFYDYTGPHCWVFMVTEITKDEDRNEIIIQTVAEDVKQGNFALVLSDRIKHCKYLAERLSAYNVTVRLLIGDKSTEERETIRQECLRGEVDVLIGTTVADEGMDIPNLNSLHLTCPSNNEGKLKQRCGRVKRSIANKDMPTIYDYVDHNIDKCCKIWWNREKWYMKWDFKLLYTEG